MQDAPTNTEPVFRAFTVGSGKLPRPIVTASSLRILETCPGLKRVFKLEIEVVVYGDRCELAVSAAAHNGLGVAKDSSLQIEVISPTD